DMRSILKRYTEDQFKANGYTFNVSNEIEGFLFKGRHAEQAYVETGAFQFVTSGGYYHSLPGDPLRTFIDTAAEVQRAMGFQNEKDHPEVAPSQFEMNYTYTDALIATDQIQLYKLLCRQVAARLDSTASFLPKPVTGINGSGMHTNMSISKDGANIFYQADGKDGLSPFAWDYVSRILNHGLELCLILNSSVNSYRRLDPHYEAPNQLKASAKDRGSVVRIPLGNSKSARVEVRAVAPDANPYLAIYSLLRTGLEGTVQTAAKAKKIITLPDNIYDAIEDFEASAMVKKLVGSDVAGKFAALKRGAADRSPRILGTLIKPSEIQYHHEVYNQQLWSKF
ncbi:MAG: glutamine synthetase, partial [Anaerolineae bacterium]|nr:glutamine synthetase [Anaerolineae bacterium]